ncbi:MAG: RluA family pseudouridine synthase [Eubacterium sp.]|jgi:23S rRNA pseudouridine955/2504/2580 synthase
MKEIIIGKNEEGQRLDRFLRKYLPEAPLSYIYRAIRKDVKINGRRASEGTSLSEGDTVSLYMSDSDIERYSRRRQIHRAKRTFGIIYEDENVLIVDKPAGLLTHGDAHEKKNHLTNQVIDYLIQNGQYDPRAEKTFTPAPANRLDRNTSGLVLFGKTAPAVRELTRLIRERNAINKIYTAIVSGEVHETMYLRGFISKDEERNVVTVQDDSTGREAETIATPVAAANGYTLLSVHILTGRTHQIRAQLSAAGFPIVGDPKYGDPKTNAAAKKKFGISAQLLHAGVLEFNVSDGILKYMDGKTFSAPLPERFSSIEKQLFGGTGENIRKNMDRIGRDTFDRTKK